MRIKRVSGAVLGAGLVAFAVSSFADDAPGPGLEGTWTGRERPGTNVMTRAVLARHPLGGFRLQAELSIGEARLPFEATGQQEGDTLEFTGKLTGGSLVSGLSGTPHADAEIEGSLELLAPDRARGRWSLSTGPAGLALLTRSGTGWEEAAITVDERGLPVPGTPEDEARLFQDLAGRVTDRQAEVAASGGVPKERGFHNKGFGLRAELRVLSDIPADLRVDLFQPGTRHAAIARFSNAPSTAGADQPFDPRGLAFRVKTGRTEPLLSGVTADARDFLLINAPTTPPDPVRFVDVALAVDTPDPVAALKALAPKYGVEEIKAILTGLARKKALQDQLRAEGKKTGMSFTEETWSNGAAIRWGPSLAVKLALVPAAVPPGTAADGPRREDMRQRLLQGDFVLDLCVQRFKNEQETPIENGGVAWSTPLEKVAQLVILRQDMEGEQARALAQEIERTSLNPWNTVETFRPLGAIMRARRVVYRASAQGRGASLCPFGFGKK